VSFLEKIIFSFEKVYSSEYCRCKDTARNAFKDFETFSGLNSTFADSSKTPEYIKKTKEFIEKLDKNKKLYICCSSYNNRRASWYICKFR
jgi:phosphohistidine phosphatase SixA